MTNPDFTAISILVDRSGSMRPLATDSEGGLAAFLEEQAKQPGTCTVRLCEFDNGYSVVYPSTPVLDAPAYTLLAGGMTAMLDAWGRSMTEFGQELAALPESERPGKVVFVVITDGQENASVEWTSEQVNALVTTNTDVYGWSFIFLAANQDAIAEGAKYGVGAGGSLTYGASPTGTRSVYAAMSNQVAANRLGKAVAFTEDQRTQVAE